MTRTENVELLDVVLQPHYMPMDIDLTVTYNEVNCSCSGDNCCDARKCRESFDTTCASCSICHIRRFCRD